MVFCTSSSEFCGVSCSSVTYASITWEVMGVMDVALDCDMEDADSHLHLAMKLTKWLWAPNGTASPIAYIH